MLESERLIAAGRVDFIDEALTDFRVMMKFVPDPGQRGGAGFVAADDHAEHFLGEFVLAHHFAAFLVFRGEQDAKQIVFHPAVHPLADEIAQEFPVFRKHPPQPQVQRRREAQVGDDRQRRDRAIAVDGERPAADAVGSAVEGVAEE